MPVLSYSKLLFKCTFSMDTRKMIPTPWVYVYHISMKVFMIKGAVRLALFLRGQTNDSLAGAVFTLLKM